MAGFNPYARRDDGEGFLTRAVKAPYRVGRSAIASAPTWVPRVAAGQGVRKLQGAYASAYDRMRAAVGVRRQATAAMRSDAGVRAAKDSLFYARRAAANRLPGLNRALDAAQRTVSETGALKRQAFSNLGKTIREGRAAIRDVAARTGEAIEAGGRKLASAAVRSTGDNAARATTMQGIRASANRQVADTVRGVGDAIRSAKTDTRVARGMFNTALQRRTAAAKAVGEVNAGIRRAESAVGAAKNAAAATRKAVIEAANSFTGLEKTALGISRGYKGATGAVRTAADTAKGVIGRAVSAVNPFASKAEFAARIAGSSTAKTGAGVAKTIGGLASKGASGGRKAVGFLAKAPVKTIAGTFNTIEKAGKLVAGTGKAANMLRAATSASGLAGGFAVGAWTDAGMKAYEFYANGGKLSDLGGSKITTINGKQVRENNPGLIKDVFLSREYWKEVGKGLQSALTLGLMGNGDDTWLDRKVDFNPDSDLSDELRKRINGEGDGPSDIIVGADGTVHEGIALDMSLKDIHGNAVYSEEELKARAQALDTASARSKAAQKFAARARGDLNVQNFRSMLGDITNQRKTALDSMEANIRNFADFSKTLRKPITEEEYRASATAKANSDYDRRMAMLLGNKAAQDVMKENRKAAYNKYGVGSGDYDADVASATGDRLNELKEFNRMWEEQSDAEKVAWTKEDAEKAMSEVAAAYKPEEVE